MFNGGRNKEVQMHFNTFKAESVKVETLLLPYTVSLKLLAYIGLLLHTAHMLRITRQHEGENNCNILIWAFIKVCYLAN